MAALLPAPFDDGGLVLVDRDPLRLAQLFERQGLELDPEILGDGAAVGQDRDVFEHRLAPIAETGGFDRGDVDRAAQLVDDQRGEGFTRHILRDDQQGTARSHHQLQQRQQVLHHAELLLVNEDVRLFEDDGHALGIGHEIRREIPAIELQALDHVE